MVDELNEVDGNIRKINGLNPVAHKNNTLNPEPRTPNPEPDFEKFLCNGNTLDKSQKQLVPYEFRAHNAITK